LCPALIAPEDSYRCFMRTEMDYLVLETLVVSKKESHTKSQS
jgi:carbamoyltransferase